MKILLADDQALFREGLEMVLARLDTRVDAVHAADFSQLLALARREFDLVLTDLALPGMDGLGALRALCHFLAPTPVVVVSASPEDGLAARVLGAGAAAYIPKTMRGRDLIETVGAVLAGRAPATVDLAPRPAPPLAGLGAHDLTPRQVEVLLLLAQGKSNKGIARELGLAEVTVKGHVTAILKTLNLDNRTQAGIIAARLEALAPVGEMA